MNQLSQNAIFFIALLRATVTEVRGDLDEVNAEAHGRRNEQIVTGIKILRVSVIIAKTFSAMTFRSHFESNNCSFMPDLQGI